MLNISQNAIEIISVHYKTPKFIYEQHQSVRMFYPENPYRIIDGSDNGMTYFADIEKTDKNFTVERFGYNIHHGPGMDHAIKSSAYEYLLILDSDIKLTKAPLQDMIDIFSGYAVGEKLMVNLKGNEKWQMRWWKRRRPYLYSYIHPYCMLISKSAYLEFNPFKKHGAPCLDAMMEIHDQQKLHLLADINIKNYVDVRTRGTRDIWGINLK